MSTNDWSCYICYNVFNFIYAEKISSLKIEFEVIRLLLQNKYKKVKTKTFYITHGAVQVVYEVNGSTTNEK